MPEIVRCVDCGFLCVRKLATRELIEAEDSFRKSSDTPSYGNQAVHEGRPLCFKAAFDLNAEVDQSGLGSQIALGRRQVAVMDNERECPAFTKWNRGFTPKEHAEMIQAEVLARWQEQQRQADRQFQADQAEASRHHNWLTLGVSVLAVLIAAYAALQPKVPRPAPIVNVAIPAQGTAQ